MLKIFSLENSVNEIVYKMTIIQGNKPRRKSWKHKNQNARRDMIMCKHYKCFFFFKVLVLIFQNEKYNLM